MSKMRAHAQSIRRLQEVDNRRIRSAGQQSGTICFLIAGACFLAALTNEGTTGGTWGLAAFGIALAFIGWEDVTGRTAERLERRREPTFKRLWLRSVIDSLDEADADPEGALRRQRARAPERASARRRE